MISLSRPASVVYEGLNQIIIPEDFEKTLQQLNQLKVRDLSDVTFSPSHFEKYDKSGKLVDTRKTSIYTDDNFLAMTIFIRLRLQCAMKVFALQHTHTQTLYSNLDPFFANCNSHYVWGLSGLLSGL